MKMKVKIKKLHPELGNLIPMPERKSAKAAGWDVCSTLELWLWPGETCLIPLGFALEIPDGYECQIRPRSGMAKKSKVTVLNAPGTIDADYRGQVGVMLINHGDEPFVIGVGDRIAQLVFAAVETPEFELTDELSETDRGAGGFGHTVV